ncbi:VG15 protein [Streptomyces sp. NPDC004376]
MASTVSDDSTGVARMRQAQTGLTRLLLRDLRSLRRLIQPNRLQATVPKWIDAVHTLVGRYAEVSASLAADFYDEQRDTARVSGVFTVPLAGAPPREQTANSLRWATKDLWPRPEAEATVAQLEPMDVRLDAAEKRAEGVVDRIVLNAGRDTMVQAVRQDREAVAYARAAALGCCSFCALLASRGAVYASRSTVGEDANERFTGDDSGIKYHDHCRCQPIPVFRGQTFQLSPKAAEWDRIYREHAAPHSGEQLQRFRAALAEQRASVQPGSF